LHFVAPPLGRRSVSIQQEFSDMNKLSILAALPLIALAACDTGGNTAENAAANGAEAANAANGLLPADNAVPADANAAAGKPTAEAAPAGGKPAAAEGNETEPAAGGKPTADEAGNAQ
jgi:hypothetical protein